MWQNQKVDFHGKHYQARGAVLDPKPVQKPYPPLLFGGVGLRMLRMAGRYGDICFIPPWAEMPFGKAKEVVLREARKNGRQTKLAFAAGSPRAPEKFDLKEAEHGVAAAAKEGCLYYMMPFPRESFSDSMKRFAKEIIPSYAGL